MLHGIGNPCTPEARNSSQNDLTTEVRPGEVWGELLSFIFLLSKHGFCLFFHLDNATLFNGVFQNVESVALFFGTYLFQSYLSTE